MKSAVGPSISGYRFSEETRRRVSEAFSIRSNDGASAFAAFWLEDPFWAPSLAHEVFGQKLQGLLIEASHNFFHSPRPVEPGESKAIHHLSEILAPTLVIVGEYDAPDNHQTADILGASIPEAEKITASGAGHMLNLEKPEEFNRLVLDFLSRVEEVRQG